MSAHKLFWHLVYNADSEQWDEDVLPALTLKHLQVLALLWGAPKSGTKEKVVIRILAVRQVRLKIARYAPDLNGAYDLSDAFLKCDLKQMCREAGQWRSGNKLQLAATLLTWRNRCRANGQQVMHEIKKLTARQPKQLSFAL